MTAQWQSPEKTVQHWELASDAGMPFHAETGGFKASVLNKASTYYLLHMGSVPGVGYDFGPTPSCSNLSSSCVTNLVGCRFLGLLHMEVFLQRLENEHKAKVISTPPTGKLSCRPAQAHAS